MCVLRGVGFKGESSEEGLPWRPAWNPSASLLPVLKGASVINPKLFQERHVAVGGVKPAIKPAAPLCFHNTTDLNFTPAIVNV